MPGSHLLLLGFLLAATPGSARQAEVVSARLSLQHELAAELTLALRDAAAPYRVHPVVELEIEGEVRDVAQSELQPQVEMTLGSPKRAVKVPGLPNIEEQGSGDVAVRIPGKRRTWVEARLDARVARVTVHLLVDRGMPDDQIKRLETIASAVAGLDPAHGDRVVIGQLPPVPPPPPPRQPPEWTVALPWLTGTLVVCALLLAVGLALGRRVRTPRTVSDRAAAGPAGIAAGDPGGAPGGEQVIELPGDARATGEGPAFASLFDATDAELAEILPRLEPTDAALVVDRGVVPPAVLGQHLAVLQPGRRLELVRALGEAREVPVAELAALDSRLAQALAQVRSRVRVGGEARLAALLEAVPPERRDQVLAELAESEPALAETLRGRMTVFEDLAKLPAVDLRRVLASVDPALMAAALHGADEALRASVLGAASPRLRAILQAELAAMNGQTPANTNAGRRVVEAAIRRLRAPVAATS